MTKDEVREYLNRFNGEPLNTKINVLRYIEPPIESTHIKVDGGEVEIKIYTIQELKKIAEND